MLRKTYLPSMPGPPRLPATMTAPKSRPATKTGNIGTKKKSNSTATSPTKTNKKQTKSSSKEKGARESPNREGTPTLPEDVMTRSTNDQMSRSTQDITEEEYKLKLAEKRRQAREKAEKEAELERQRQEELRRQEEERLRLEELEQKRLEEESIRLAEEAKKAEEERFLKAIEAEEQRKKDEAERLEVEKKQKEEAERKAKEEAERLEKERIERAKKEEEERLARKKRLEMIMKRVKTDTDTVRQDSPSKSLQSSPSRSSNSSTEISPDEKPEEELHPTAPTTDTLNKASSQEDMRSSGDEEKSTAKFKSPLLKQLMDKRTDDSSTDGSPKFKSPILQNILGKSKSNLGNRLMKTSSSEKLGSSQESLDQPINDSIYNAKDVERRKSDADKDVDTAEGNHVDKQKSLNRLSVSFDHSVGMDDSGFADSNGSTKVPQIDVNGTAKPVGLSTESVIVSLVDNDLDNRENTEHSTLPGALSWASPGKTSAPVTTSALTHQTSGEDTTTIAGVCDTTTTLASSAKCPQDEINPLIDLSLANKNIDLKSQQLQDNLRNNSDDLLNFNSINAGTGDHSPLIPFEDNASQRQDVTGFPMQNSFKDSMLAGNSNIISISSNCSSHDPLRTPSAFCPQTGSAATVATDHHNSSQGTDVHLNGVNPDLPNDDASLMLPLPPFTSSDLLSTTLNSTMPVTSSASCLSQPLTGTTNGSSENGLCTEDSEDYFLSTHHHCHGSISSSDSGVISSAGSQEEEMPLETSPSSSSEQPASCGSTLSMGDVGGGKYQISLAEVADNGTSDDGIEHKQYLKNSVHSVINPMNSSSSEMSPVSWIQTSSTLTNANINIVSDRLSSLANNPAVNANPDSFSKKVAPVNNNNHNPSSVGYLWQQFEKLMPRKHESVSATLHQYGIGKGAGLSHGMENSEEDQFWDIVQSRSFLNIA